MLYIALTVWLVQRGSSESKEPGDEGRESDAKQLVGSFRPPGLAGPGRGAGGWRTRIYSHSLVLVMGAWCSSTSWSAQAVAGRVARQRESGCASCSTRSASAPTSYYPDFWGRTLQNWQSELLAIGTMAVFAIYLRERGSPESKEVGAPHGVTRSSD